MRPSDVRFARGLVYGMMSAACVWVLIVWGICEAIK